jgi:hypothetical protein
VIIYAPNPSSLIVSYSNLTTQTLSSTLLGLDYAKQSKISIHTHFYSVSLWKRWPPVWAARGRGAGVPRDLNFACGHKVVHFDILCARKDVLRKFVICLPCVKKQNSVIEKTLYKTFLHLFMYNTKTIICRENCRAHRKYRDIHPKFCWSFFYF